MYSIYKGNLYCYEKGRSHRTWPFFPLLKHILHSVFCIGFVCTLMGAIYIRQAYYVHRTPKTLNMTPALSYMCASACNYTNKVLVCQVKYSKLDNVYNYGFRWPLSYVTARAQFIQVKLHFNWHAVCVCMCLCT